MQQADKTQKQQNMKWKCSVHTMNISSCVHYIIIASKFYRSMLIFQEKYDTPTQLVYLILHNAFAHPCPIFSILVYFLVGSPTLTICPEQYNKQNNNIIGCACEFHMEHISSTYCICMYTAGATYWDVQRLLHLSSLASFLSFVSVLMLHLLYFDLHLKKAK